MSKLLRFVACSCSDVMHLHMHHGSFLSRIGHHVSHHMNLAILIGAVGLTAVGGLAMATHELKNPEVTFYRSNPQHVDFRGGNFKRED